MKTFYVQISIGHRIIARPLGRLEIADDALHVRAWPAWMMRPRFASKQSIAAIRVRQSYSGTMVLTIDDEAGTFDNVHLYALPRGYRKLRAGLEENGYVVIGGDQPRRTLISVRRRRGRS